MNKVFANQRNQLTDHNWLKTRAILALKNVAGKRHMYNSIDAVLNIDEAVNYPAEFLNSLTPPGLPPHNLHPKIGAPVMLLRNLDASKLCNGTRLIVKKMISTLLETTILTGKASGEPVFIPRVPLIPSDMSFQYKRLQFPLKLSFEMSIKKAQSQSLNVVGLNIEEQVFSHGQLYVGCSRVGNPNHLFIYAAPSRKDQKCWLSRSSANLIRFTKSSENKPTLEGDHNRQQYWRWGPKECGKEKDDGFMVPSLKSSEDS
eukprot:XP_014778520.1 PREDICTED: uncharacterized protein LOC106875070 [Octopus bimaculoides]